MKHIDDFSSQLEILPEEGLRFLTDIEAGNLSNTVSDNLVVHDFQESYFSFFQQLQAGVTSKSITTTNEIKNLLQLSLGKYWDIYWHNIGVYKQKYRYPLQLSKLLPYIPKDGNILDFGAGKGGVLNLLSHHNDSLKLHACDVISYLLDDVKSRVQYTCIPNSLDRTSYDNNFFDKVIVQHVLHHMNSENLDNNFSEVHRVAKDGNIVVVEDVYGLSEADLDVDCNVSQKYTTFPSEVQRAIIAVRDWFRNIIIYGVEVMNMPFEYKTIPQWEEFFNKNGLQITDKDVSAFKNGKTWFNSGCNVVFNLQQV